MMIEKGFCLTAGNGKGESGLAAFAWDAEGEKLAVALEEDGSDQCSSGRIAVFATSYKPIIGMRLLGFTAENPMQPASPAADGAHWICGNCLLRLSCRMTSLAWRALITS